MTGDGDERLPSSSDRLLNLLSGMAQEIAELNEQLEHFDRELALTLATAFSAGILVGYLLGARQ